MILPFLLAPLLLAGTAPPDSLSLRRGPCFGNCPVYEVILRSDGSATYLGGDYAPRRGRFEGRVDRAAVEALLRRLDDAGFWGMRVDEQLPVMDLPEAVLTAAHDGRTHRVHSNLPPRPLERLMAAVDSLAADVDWHPAPRPAPPAQAMHDQSERRKDGDR